MTEFSADRPCRILSLDGGGAKGFYTIGVLKGIEGMLGGRLHEHFDIVFGTSTGAIISALVALGHPVDEIHDQYKEHVVKVMGRWFPWTKSAALRELADKVFEDKTFDAVRTNVGIVTTRWAFETPMIFKTSVAQAHGDRGTFIPGFGCTIGDAVQASCSAYPFFPGRGSLQRTASTFCSPTAATVRTTRHSTPSPMQCRHSRCRASISGS